MDKICKFFVQGKCREGNKCKFIHDKDICRNFFLRNNCNKGAKCRFKHSINGKPIIPLSNKPKNNRNKTNLIKKKNTESFKPSHKPPNMRVIVEHGGLKYPRKHKSNDIIIVNGLFCKSDDLDIYNRLLDEIKNSGIDRDNLWKLWHGDTHLIVDDKKKWKEKCPTFTTIIDKIRDYFDVDIKATRFNLYENSLNWKPFHHDAAAVKKDKAKTQNITIGVSFGLEREAAFEHAETRTVISVPLPNGSIYVFNKDVNIEWRHGILQMDPENKIDKGRISIIAWGKVEMENK